jgi:hypothetical protein
MLLTDQRFYVADKIGLRTNYHLSVPLGSPGVTYIPVYMRCSMI